MAKKTQSATHKAKPPPDTVAHQKVVTQVKLTPTKNQPTTLMMNHAVAEFVEVPGMDGNKRIKSYDFQCESNEASTTTPFPPYFSLIPSSISLPSYFPLKEDEIFYSYSIFFFLNNLL